ERLDGDHVIARSIREIRSGIGHDAERSGHASPGLHYESEARRRGRRTDLERGAERLVHADGADHGLVGVVARDGAEDADDSVLARLAGGHAENAVRAGDEVAEARLLRRDLEALIL